ncbi:hypothetical protein KYK29_03200 [Shinella daejeonensis]|uniref:hypothetical protein n=1 Tax=Shinella daejeonensis TaxID=659017 RepID=UPI0020C78046|nr:hypothetical protein [Shinella daejeonensis]MCP8893922.1 hypothetical protein [Shinella daejeonensis]
MSTATEELAKLEDWFRSEREKLAEQVEAENEKARQANEKAEEKRIAALKAEAGEHARYIVEDVSAKLDVAIAEVAKLLKERLAAFDEIHSRYSSVCNPGHHARNPRINSGCLGEILNIALRERRAPLEGGYKLADMRALGAVYSPPEPKKKAKAE